MKNKTKWAIIGAGNGGHAVAGYLGYLGYEVNIYDTFEKTIGVIKEQGGIEIDGTDKGFGKVKVASTNIEEVIKDTDIIMVINPSMYHRSIAEKCAKYIKKNQVVFLHPGATFGAFAFKKALEDFGCKEDIVIAESNTLIYAARSLEPGKVDILGRKDRLLVAALPAVKTKEVVSMLQEVYPEIEAAENVLVTSIDSTNPIVHCTPTILSTSWIESGKDWHFYTEGMSKSIGNFVEKLDTERIELGKKLGLIENDTLLTCLRQYEFEYNVKESTLSKAVKNTEAYADIIGPKSLNTRYLFEDIPMGLIPLVSLAKQLDIKTDRMDLIIKMAEYLLEEDFYKDARTSESLGLEGMNAKEVIEYATTGKKPY